MIMELKSAHPTTDMAQRRRIVKLWIKGNSARAIAQQTGFSATTVCRWIKRWKNEGHATFTNSKQKPRKYTKWNVLHEPTVVPHSTIFPPSANLWRLPCHEIINDCLNTDQNSYRSDTHSYLLASHSLIRLRSMLNIFFSSRWGPWF